MGVGIGPESATMGDNTCFLSSNVRSGLYIDKKGSFIGISCQAPLSIWVPMLVIIIIAISPLVIIFFQIVVVECSQDLGNARRLISKGKLANPHACA